MTILTIDTSSGPVCVAIYRDGAILSELNVYKGRAHSENLHFLIDSAMQACNVTANDLNAVASVVGPGSFTGLRIGVSAAKALAYAADIPCIAVNTLESIAMNFAYSDKLIVPMMDARREQVYGGIYDVSAGYPTELLKCAPYALDDILQKASELAEKTGKGLLFAGDGTARFTQEITNAIPDANTAPQALMLQRGSSTAILAAKAYADGNTVSAEKLSPNYLRSSSAKTTAEREAIKAAKNK